MVNKTGKAYAFFDCEASKGDIEKELPPIRECVETPNEPPRAKSTWHP